MDIFTLGLKADSRDIRRGQSDLERLADTGEKTERRVRSSTRRMSAGFRDMQSAIRTAQIAAAAYASVRTVQGIARISDEYAQMTGRLRLVTDSTSELTFVQSELFQIAQRTSSQFGGVIDLYTKTARATEELGFSQRQTLEFVQLTNQAFQVSGASSAEAAGAIRQLSQALQSGVLRGDEFNSINEQGGRIMQALADGMGVARGELRGMAEQGQLTADVVMPALLSQAAQINSEFLEMPRTVGRAMTEFRNEFGSTVASADVTGLVDSIDSLKQTLGDPQVTAGLVNLAQGITDAAAVAVRLAAGINDVTVKIAELAASAVVGGDTPLERLRDDIVRTERALQSFASGPGFNADMVARLNEQLERLRSQELKLLMPQIKAMDAEFQEFIDGVLTGQGVMERYSTSVDSVVPPMAAFAVTTTEAAEATKTKTAAEIAAEAAARKLAEQVKQNNAAVVEQIRLLERQIELVESGVDLDRAARRAELEAQGIREETIQEYFRLTDTIEHYEFVRNRAAENEKAAAAVSEDAARRQAEAYERAAGRIENTFADLFRNLLSNTSNFGDALVNSIREFGVNHLVTGFTTGTFTPLSSNAGGVGLLEQGVEFLGNRLISIGEDFGFEAADTLGSHLLDNAQSYGNAIGAAAALAMAHRIGGQLGENLGLNPQHSGAAAVLAPELAFANLLTFGALEQAGEALFGGRQDVHARDLTVVTLSDGSVSAIVDTVIRESGGVFEGSSYSEQQEFLADLSDGMTRALQPVFETARQGNELFGTHRSSALSTVNVLGREDETAAITTELLSDLTDQIALESLPSLADFRQGNEALTVTLARVVGQTEAVVNSYTDLGFPLETGNEALAAMAVNLIEAAGGISEFNRAMSTLEGFASQDRRDELVIERLNRDLGDLTALLPSTREQFFDLFDTFDAGTQGPLIAAIDTIDEYYAIQERGAAAMELAAEKAEAFRQTVLDFDIAFGLADPLTRLHEQLRELGLSSNDLYNAAVFGEAGIRDWAASLTEAQRFALAPFTQQIREFIDITRLADIGLTKLPSNGVGFGNVPDVIQDAADAFDRFVPTIRDATGAIDDAARIAEGIAREREGLERRLFALMGDTAALRAMELASLHPSNRALLERIFALEDEQAAQEALSKTARQATDMILRLRDAAAGITEVTRTPGQNLAQLQQTLFASANLARAGDLAAAGRLAQIADQIADAADAQAATREERDRIVRQTAAILGSTADAIELMGGQVAQGLGMAGLVARAPLTPSSVPQLATAQPGTGGNDVARLERAIERLNADTRRGFEAVVDRSEDTNRILDGWDIDGLPEERATA